MNARIVGLATLVLWGCGPQSVVSDGVYAAVDSSGPLGAAQLTVDLSAKTASVTPGGSSTAVVLTLGAVSPSAWEKGCPTNFSSVSTETWTLSPDPAVLGGLSLEQPRLVAGCGQDTAKPDEVVLKGTGAPNSTGYSLLFRRLTR